MKILKRAAAAFLACAAVLFMLTACSEADVNNFINGVGSSAKGLVQSAVTWVGATAGDKVDAVYQGAVSGLESQYGTSVKLEEYRQEILKEINYYRKQAGLAELTMNNSKLNEAAQRRAVEITTEYFPAHKRNGGKDSCFTILPEVGLTSKVDYNYSGENIASGWFSPQLVVAAWMNSDGHRANILNSKFTQIGIGYNFDASSEAKFYWSQMFLG